MLTGFPVYGKAKSRDLIAAFIAGAPADAQGAVFYGVDDSNYSAWRSVLENSVDYYYLDNAYYDHTRGTYFRVTRNAVQHSGRGASDGKRFAALGIPIEPWRQAGEHVLLVPQSESYMRQIACAGSAWQETTAEALRHFTSRPIRVRAWNRDKRKAAATLSDDLAGAHAVVTWSSAAAVTAVLSGVPVVCTGPCAAAPMGGDLAYIESLPRPARETWAGVLADNQFTVDELGNGLAWAMLNRGVH